MRYTIDWLESDQYKNIIASLTREDGAKLLKVNLGKEFVDKGLMPGHEIQGNEWTSPKNGKVYVFEDKTPPGAPTHRLGANTGSRTASITKAMDRKEESIGKTLDRKEESIKMAGAQRDAVLIVTQILAGNNTPGAYTNDDIRKEIIDWRNWFLNDKDFNNPPPF